MDKFFGLDHAAVDKDEAALLTTVHDNVELSVLRSILDGEKIAYRIRERGSGGVVRVISGYTMFGTDILVAPDDLAAAQEVLDAYRNGTVVEDGAESAELAEDDE